MLAFILPGAVCFIKKFCQYFLLRVKQSHTMSLSTNSHYVSSEFRAAVSNNFFCFYRLCDVIHLGNVEDKMTAAVPLRDEEVGIQVKITLTVL